MNENLKKAVELLKSENLTCVLLNNETVYTSRKRGVKPLLDLISNKTSVQGFYAADKVVGKGAAYLYVLLKVKEVYACTISLGALEVFEKYKIKVYFDKKADYIVNRLGTGMCPMENAVLEAKDPNDALNRIKARLKQINIQK